MNIKISNLSFKYKKQEIKEAVSNVDLFFKESTINVLLGLNGSGKTTLLKLLVGLLQPISGNIFYGEKDLKSIKIAERSKIFSYVPQHINLFSDVKISDYLSFSLVNKLAFYKSPNECLVKRVKKIAKELGIEKLLNKCLGEISGGEKQKVLIAAALVQDTPVIILDEPTSALDLKNQNMVLSMLKKIKDTGKTILLSIHNPNHALFLDANVSLIQEGKIVETGTAEEIIKIEKLRKIYGADLCKSSELQYEEISFK